MRKDRENFDNWLLGSTDWKEVLYLYNTGLEYQDKQSLFGVFYNSYIYIKQKADSYVNEFHCIPRSTFRRLIFEFRQIFSQKNRIEGINYFDDLLIQLIEEYEETIKSNHLGDNIELIAKSDKLRMTQIALICFYLNERITSNNASEIARKHKFISKTSGHKLYQKFNKYSKKINRVGDEGTKIKNKNKRDLFKSLFEHLPESNHELLNSELRIIEQNLNSY